VISNLLALANDGVVVEEGELFPRAGCLQQRIAGANQFLFIQLRAVAGCIKNDQ